MIYTFDDIVDKIDEFVNFEKQVSFLVRGYLCEDVEFYITQEIGYEQFIEEGYEKDYIIDEYDNNKMYWISISPQEKLYDVQEAVYNGILLMNDDTDIVYYQENTILSNENEDRILGNIFEFLYSEDLEEENYQQLCPNESCSQCGECFDTVKLKDDEKFLTEKQTDKLVNTIYKSTYEVNGKEVTKEEYEKELEEFDKKWKSFHRTFDEFDRLMEYFREYM